MNYQDWITQLSVLLPQPLAAGGFNAAAPFVDVNYNNVIPRAIEFAELLIYRDPDFNFLAASTVDSSGQFTPGNRLFTIPSQIIVVEQLAAIVPSGKTPSAGRRVQFLPTTVEFINQAWPEEFVTFAPSVGGPGPWFAMLDNNRAIVAPTPPLNYTVEVTGIQRPTPLQQSAASTSYLTLNMPDLFTSASMIYWTAVMKDWGAQTDDPKMALSWQSAYEAQKAVVASEAARQRAQGFGWSTDPLPKFTGEGR